MLSIADEESRDVDVLKGPHWADGTGFSAHRHLPAGRFAGLPFIERLVEVGPPHWQARLVSKLLMQGQLEAVGSRA